MKLFKISEDGVHKTYNFMGIKFHKRVFDKSDYRLAIRAAMLANSVAKIHSYSFDKYKNINEGKSVALIATGPTLSQYKQIPNVVNVGVSKSFLFDKLNLDYLFIQDFNSKDYICRLLEEKYSHIKKFIGILPQSNLIIPESLALKLKASRYFTDEICKPHQFAYDISSTMLGDFNSVSFSAMQFILWTNPDKIYLVGCDCSSGYFDKTKSTTSMNKLIGNWIMLKKFAETYYPDTKIISVNPVGLKGIFTDLYQ